MKLIKSRYIKGQKGDTMVEVMLGVVILSIVLAAAYTLGNRATRIGGDASERTMVANLLQQQAERIKNARVDGAVWANIDSELYSSGGPNFATCSPPSPGASNPFIIRDDLSVSTATPDFTNSFYTIWVEGYKNDPVAPTHADFYIRACWQGRESNDQRSNMFIRVNLP